MPALHAEALAEHVILISVDGFRPDFYLEDDWPMPMLAQMAREGAKAEGVRSVFPSVTYPSHTTIVTGALPARHGIYYNTPFEEGGQTGRWYWEESSIKVETLFEAVRKAGGKTAGVSWPVTVGAPIDWLVPEVWSLDREGDRLAPMREGASPGLWSELEQNATGTLTRRNMSADWINRDDSLAAMAAYLIETKKPTLLAIHVAATDHFKHQDGRRSDLVLRSLCAADRAISAMVEATQRGGIADKTAFVVTGDHGFVDLDTTVSPNVWLVQAGLRRRSRSRRGVEGDVPLAGRRHLPSPARSERSRHRGSRATHDRRAAGIDAAALPHHRPPGARRGRRRARGSVRPGRLARRDLQRSRRRRGARPRDGRNPRLLPARLPADPDRLRRLGRRASGVGRWRT